MRFPRDLDPTILAWAILNYSRVETADKEIDFRQFGLKVRPHVSKPIIDVLRKWEVLAATNYSSWANVDISHIKIRKDLINSGIDLIVALYPVQDLLTQQIIGYLTMRDVKDSHMSLITITEIVGVDLLDPVVLEASIKGVMKFDEESSSLAKGFAQKMLLEALNSSHAPLIGAYTIERPEIDLLDSLVRYTDLRLVFTQRGIIGSMINREEGSFAPFFWSPEGTNTIVSYAFPELTFAMDIMLSGLWRDSHIVQEEFITTTAGNGGRVKSTLTSSERTRGAISIPRKIRRYSWKGSIPGIGSKRDKSYLVGGCYPHVPKYPENHPTQEAIERANEAGYPAPPMGRTFRVPYPVGEIDKVPVRDLVWKGKDIVRLALTIR